MNDGEKARAMDEGRVICELLRVHPPKLECERQRLFGYAATLAILLRHYNRERLYLKR